MAEELLRGPERDADTIEKGGSAPSWWPKRGDGYPAIQRTLKIGAAADHVTRGAPNTAPRPARVGTMPVHARDHFFARLGAGNKQIQQSRGAPNLMLEALENSRIHNRRGAGRE